MQIAGCDVIRHRCRLGRTQARWWFVFETAARPEASAMSRNIPSQPPRLPAAQSSKSMTCGGLSGAPRQPQLRIRPMSFSVPVVMRPGCGTRWWQKIWQTSQWLGQRRPEVSLPLGARPSGSRREPAPETLNISMPGLGRVETDGGRRPCRITGGGLSPARSRR